MTVVMNKSKCSVVFINSPAVEDHLNLLSVQYLVQSLDRESVCSTMDHPAMQIKEMLSTRRHQTVCVTVANKHQNIGSICQHIDIHMAEY